MTAIVDRPLGDQLIYALQTHLARLGYYRIRVDGLKGPGTSDAIIRFKAAHGLRARDFVGPKTFSLIGSPDAKPWVTPHSEAEPRWLDEARALLGTREAPGKANNPVIMDWAVDLDQWYPGDDVPWCGLFVAHCMAVGAPDEPQGFNRLGARQWQRYGELVDLDDPLPLGGVATFWRVDPDDWRGHVALITGQNDSHVRCIGGNQSNAVTEAWFPRSRLLGVTIPHDHDPTPAPTAATGTLSTSEA